MQIGKPVSETYGFCVAPNKKAVESLNFILHIKMRRNEPE